ncbi:hypothetical protein cyc_01264 [Cyclospora cayetanensis]|uniref:RNA-editing substrate-binding complex 6 protein domain-containing protein n=1 Tax=Cyclospora cayetanensis TaxID=88456 RepID=A0A1D3D140_9EIME|nr:hypothetical protein cyc_01264 [Cyclospora cayetanensis]
MRRKEQQKLGTDEFHSESTKRHQVSAVHTPWREAAAAAAATAIQAACKIRLPQQQEAFGNGFLLWLVGVYLCSSSACSSSGGRGGEKSSEGAAAAKSLPPRSLFLWEERESDRHALQFLPLPASSVVMHRRLFSRSLSCRSLQVSLDGSSSLGSEAVVSLLTAFAALQFRDENLLICIQNRLLEIAASLKPKDLANTAHALAKLHVHDTAAFSAIAESLLPRVASLTPMGLSKTATAFTWAELGDTRLLAAVMAQAAARRDAFPALEAINFIRALARVSWKSAQKADMRLADCISSLLGGALQRGIGGVSTELQVQLLESLVALQHYDGVYVHRKLLPALLARLPQPASVTALRRKGDRRLELYARLLRCLCTFPAASPVSLDLLSAILEDLPTAITVSPSLASTAEAIAALHELKCSDYSCFSAAEAALLRDRRQTLQQLRPVHIRDLRKAYEAFGSSGEEAWKELLHFLSRVESALVRAGAALPGNDAQQQPPQEEGERKHQHHVVIAHTYSSAKGHEARKVPLSRGLSVRLPEGELARQESDAPTTSPP